jgi:threonine dehydrogenase-like Zn-dependent dehydrogenase
MYEGRTDFKPGGIFGHENTDEVVEVGPGISLQKGVTNVSLPFNIGCGFCKDCEAGLTAYCLTVYPKMSGAVKHYDRQLRNLIHAGRARSSWIISRRLPLDEAPNAYKHFDARDNEWTKVVLRPAVRYGKLARKWGAEHRSQFSFWICAGDRYGTTVFRSHST